MDVFAAVRERLEERERSLSPYAAKSFHSRGRDTYEDPSPLRTEFQRDRDRIVHSKAFRRLMRKTQVFIAPVGDHFVTRMTHTLQVAQIARTIARALNLNEDLAEAISLGHDLGHPPFGHAGEQALAELLPEGFRHAQQSLRVIEKLERLPGGKPGLNLTWEVRDGIVNSSKVREDILAEGFGKAASLEGQIVKLADAVAYINHDITDAVRAGLIQEDDLPVDATQALGRSHSERINTLVCDIVENSWAVTGQRDDGPAREITMSPLVLDAANALREFMFQRVYLWEGRRREAEKAQQIVRQLFSYYLANADQVPDDFVDRSDPRWQRASDYVAGMTDDFALATMRRLQGSGRSRGRARGAGKTRGSEDA